jgi:hypothetical protein
VPATTRRTAIGVALLGLGITAGCDLGASGDDGEPADRPDEDVVLTEDVRAEIAAVAALVSAAGERFPRLAEPLTPLVEMHAAHTDALGERSTPGPSPSGSPSTAAFAGPAAALRTVRAREQRLQGVLTDAAVAARSGTLARLLASMSAGVAQHLASLPAEVSA